MASQFTYTILTGLDSAVGSIRYWAQHPSIPAEQILEEAQRWIFSRLRVREMIESETFSILTDASTLALPDGFQDPIALRLYGDSEDLDFVQENLLSRIYDDDGMLQTSRPSRWAIWDELIQFDVPSDDDIGGILTFYGTPEIVSDSNESNFLCTRYPTVLRRTCLAMAYEHRKRDDFKAEYALAEAAIEQANATSDMGRRGQILR